MKIEILYPELCNLFGDLGNVKFLEQSLPDAEFVYTSINDIPAFADGSSDMIYMGASTENNQEKIIERLRPYREKLQEAIDSGKVILLTGNAPEVLFEYIEKDDKSRVEGLGILKFHAVQSLFNRYNTLVLGSFDGKDIVGFKTQFTQTYGDNTDCFFTSAKRGTGINKESNLEGIHINNLFATSMVGPLLVLNPYFTEYLMSKLGIENPECAFRKEAVQSYERRVKEFKSCRSVH